MADDTPLPSLPVTTTTSCPTGNKRYALVEVATNTSSACTPCEASSTTSGAESSDDCPANPAPLYSKTVSTTLTVPGVGSEFSIPMCSVVPWIAGMWIEHETLGRFPIIRIEGTTLIVRNSCDDGGEIPGNAGSGSQATGQKKVWPTGNACTLKEEVFEAVEEFFVEAEEFCPNMPEITGTQKIKLIGPLAECTNPCDGEVSEGDNCLKKVASVYANNETIVAPAMPEIALECKTVNGASFPVQFLGYDPRDGSLKRIILPSEGSYAIKVESGCLTFGASEVQHAIYDVPKLIASGTASASLTSKDLQTVAGVTKPSWATHAIVEAFCQIQIGDPGAPITAKPNISVFLNTQLATTVGKDTTAGSLYRGHGANTREMTVKVNGSTITYSVSIDNISADTQNTLEWSLRLMGWTVAQAL